MDRSLDFPPIICGGVGLRRTPDLAARFADEFNIGLSREVPATKAAFDRVRAACERHGRDPSSIVCSVATTVCCGASAAEARERAQRGGIGLDELAEIGMAGTPAELTELVLRFREAGAERFYLRLLDLTDLDHLGLIAAEVMPHV